MKIAHLFLPVFALTVLFTACSSNDDSTSEQEETTLIDPIITSSKGTYLGVPVDPNAYISKTIYTTTIDENQKQLVTSEVFFNDESQGVSTEQVYTFNDSGTVSRFIIEAVDNQLIRDYFYDDQQRLIGANLGTGSPHRFFRFQHISESTVYFEETSLPYNDPNTEVGRRFIIQFDVNDNIIKAGSDSDFDGNMDSVNNFQYDDNNNLISGQMASGETFSIAYSSIIDTEVYLQNKTFGKKTNRILSGELFGGNSTQFFTDGSSKSYNVTLEESQQSTFETLSNNFYSKKITRIGYNPDIEESFTQEYTFQ